MLKVLIGGDFCSRGRIHNIIESGNYKDIFGNVNEYTSQVDYSIVNLEAPIVETEICPIEKCGPNLRCSSNVISSLKYAGFDMVTLANNHICDFGEMGLRDTIRVCRENNVDFVGAGINLAEAATTFYKKIKGKILAVINCCEHEFSIAKDTIGGCNPLNPVQQYYAIREAKKKSDYVLVIIHGGHEHFQLPSPRMKETYRFFVDAGADAVINHHQHCYSGYEVYKGKPIFYGIGNFCFDIAPTRKNSMWNYGFLVEVDLDEEVNFRIFPYNQCSENPTIEFVDNFAFNSRLQELNGIIVDNAKLNKYTEEYYASVAVTLLDMFQPYEHRILNKLYRMKIFPSMISKRKLLKLYNYINCESHRDKLLYAFSKVVNRNS